MALVPRRINLTRPANTTAYAANDAISDATSSASDIVSADLGPGYITGIPVATNKVSNTPRLRLHFYRNTAPTQINDNAASTAPLDADLDANKYLGAVTMPEMTSGGGGDSSFATNMDLRVPLDTDSYYFIIETMDVFTPASGQIFRFRFYVERMK